MCLVVDDYRAYMQLGNNLQLRAFLIQLVAYESPSDLDRFLNNTENERNCIIAPSYHPPPPSCEIVITTCIYTTYSYRIL